MSAALKSKEAEKVSTLRLLVCALKAKEKEKFAVSPESVLSEADCIAVLQKEAKKRKESIQAFSSAGRDDLVKKEESELGIIETYLPKAMPREEIESLVAEVISSGATSFPEVIKIVLARTGGRADGKAVSEIIKSKLG